MRVHGVVMVTGAQSGLGLDLTRCLIDTPTVTKVYATYRNHLKTEELQKISDPYHKLRLVEMDITKDWSIENVVSAIEKATGKVNVVFCQAHQVENYCSGAPATEALFLASASGGLQEMKSKGGSLENCERLCWLQQFDKNVVSLGILIKNLLPLLKKSLDMKESTTIVNLTHHESADISVDQIALLSAYSATQAAVRTLTESLCKTNPQILTVTISRGSCRKSALGYGDDFLLASNLIRTVDWMKIEEHSGKMFDRLGRPI